MEDPNASKNLDNVSLMHDDIKKLKKKKKKPGHQIPQLPEPSVGFQKERENVLSKLKGNEEGLNVTYVLNIFLNY